MAPLWTSAMALAGGTVLDRFVTSPLGTLGLRMQTQDKTFFTALHETSVLKGLGNLFMPEPRRYSSRYFISAGLHPTIGKIKVVLSHKHIRRFNSVF